MGLIPIRNRVMATCALAALTAAALPPARFYGLSSGNVATFTATSNGRTISILFDTFKVDLGSAGSASKSTAVRRFTLAASPAAVGCRISLLLRGAALAHETPRAGAVTLAVDGRTVKFRPKADEWTLTTRAVLARHERTDVVITLYLSTLENKGSELLELNSVDIVLGKCRGRK